MANVLNIATQSILRPVIGTALRGIANPVTDPTGVIAQMAGEGFNPNDYPNLIADLNPAILSSILDDTDTPIAGIQAENIKSVLDSADSPTAVRWWNTGFTKEYWQSVSGHPAIFLPTGTSLKSVDGATGDIQIHSSSQMTIFAVGRLASSTNGLLYMYRSTTNADGLHGIIFDTRTQKRISIHYPYPTGTSFNHDMPARDITLEPRVLSVLADHHGGNVKSYRDGADEVITASHATSEYYRTTQFSEIGHSTSSHGGFILRVLVYDGLLSQVDHDAIAAALVALYV